MKEDVPLAHAGMAAQFDLQKQYYEDGKVFILQIESTLKCSQLCNYCYAGSTPESPQGMASEKIRDLLDVAASLKVQMIDWLGGDPLMRIDWEDLCSYATSLGLVNNIWTSGIPLANPRIAARAVKVTRGGFISTHLDSLNPNIYATLHGVARYSCDVRNIHRILEGIKNCLAEGKDPGSMVNCITLTTPLAAGDARETISYFQEKFGIKTCLTLFNPVIHRSGNPSWEPSNAQIRQIFEFRDRINYPRDPSCGSMDVSKFYCGTLVCVTAEGWVVPCSVIRTKEFGNVNQEQFSVILERGRRRLLFLDFRDSSKLPGNCGSCCNNSVCFGCRSSAYYYAGDILAADPKCFQYCSSHQKGGKST
jgi:MoaA/NifB/PqqE/SkfB family radical SAM enzyme